MNAGDFVFILTVETGQNIAKNISIILCKRINHGEISNQISFKLNREISTFIRIMINQSVKITIFALLKLLLMNSEFMKTSHLSSIRYLVYPTK